ncbi:hypothetical protein ACFT9I_37595 [Streptomyces sp. NPDC057137]|uniref:hypothetical protein n=1 Tax=Streptomyces sp. NPDC057137 TaxID=3346030 RepID=UPI0036360791
MRLADHHVVSAAYALADQALTRALIPRIREETVELLRSAAPLPQLLLEEVLASRDPELCAALVSSAVHRGYVFGRLAALGDPALATSLYGAREWERTPAQRSAVWEGAAATADDPGWRAADGLLTKLMSSMKPELLEPALLAPFPELAAHARSVLDDRAKRVSTRPPVNARPVNNTPPKTHPTWRRRPRTTKELVGDLRDKSFFGEIDLPTAPDALDWGELAAEHRADPFYVGRLRILWTHPGCPEELTLSAFEKTGDGAGPSMLTTAALESADGEAFARLLRPGISSGAFPVDRVLREVGPARKVLCSLPDNHAGVRAALVAQVARLGSDFAPWRAVYALLPRFSGTVTELVDAALAETPKHRGKTWPKPVGPEFPSRPQSGGRAAWLRLYDAADHPTRCVLGEHMDGRAIQQLLLWHRPSPELRAHIVQSRGPSVLAGIASDWQTAPEVIEELIPYNDSEVNAALFLNTDLTTAQRRHILSGRRWQDGVSADTPAADRLPLAEPLMDGVRESARRPWLLACADSGDPLLCRILLGTSRAKIHTPALEILMLVRLWERHGPDEVRELLDETDFPGRKQSKHPLSQKTLAAGRTALDAAAEAEAELDGLALLRAAFETAAGPAGRADFLCDKGAGIERDDLQKAIDLFEEEIGPGPVPWAELEAGHGVKPLHDRLLVRLAELDGCPPALTAESADAGLRLSHPEYRPRRGVQPPTASEMLKKLPLQVDNGGCRWLERAHHLGQVTLPEVVLTGFPAQATVAFLTRALAPGDSPATEEIRETRRAVAALAAEHLADNPEGWALALRLIPDFEGTLPDLLLASGAVLS